jgi:hypothetical protein
VENRPSENAYLDGGLFVYLYVSSLISSISWLNVQRFLPRIFLLMPHIILIGVILATYRFPSKAAEDPISESEQSIPWQANIQGLQNLMGAM